MSGDGERPAPVFRPKPHAIEAIFGRRAQGKPSFCAGPRIAHFDRVQWQTTPDPATQAAALQAGEVDWVEQPLMDLVGRLRADKSVEVQVAETKGLIGFLRFNQLFPPFDNPAIRRVALHAVNQKDFMEAVVGSNASYDARVGVFAPGSAMATDAGMEALSRQYGIDTLKQQLAQAGYKGEKVVYLAVNDVPRVNAIAEVGADMLRKIGMNVDEVATDWGSVAQRSVSRQPLDKSGWSALASFYGGYDTSDPAINNRCAATVPMPTTAGPTARRSTGTRDRGSSGRVMSTASVVRMITSVNAITLATHDMAKAVAFYATLGFELKYGGPDASFTSFQAGSGHLNLTAVPADKVWSWWGRAIFYVDDVDAQHARAVSAGLQPAFMPRDAPWGERYFHIVDPDGHELSFARLI